MDPERPNSGNFRGLKRAQHGILEEAATETLALPGGRHRQAGQQHDGDRMTGKALVRRFGASPYSTWPTTRCRMLPGEGFAEIQTTWFQDQRVELKSKVEANGCRPRENRSKTNGMEVVAIAVRYGATRPAYVNGPNLTLLLQRQRGMKGIPFEQGEFTVSQGRTFSGRES